MKLSDPVIRELDHCGLDVAEVRGVVETALTEDLRYGPDITTQATVPRDQRAVAELTPRSTGVLAGLPVALAVFDAVLGGFRSERYVARLRQRDGDLVHPGAAVLVIEGSTAGLLTAERTALNIVSHLSGVATATAAWVRELEGTGCVVRDTRKTLPGLRVLQKYAVRCGGGANHRLGLGDAVLVKDNHVIAAGSVTAALKIARAQAPDLPCEVEVTTLAELDAVLAEGAELVLLDNFTPHDCTEAVRRTRAAGTGTLLEASGGLELGSARAYAEAGVDFVAVGALTHSAPVLDLGLDLS